MNATVWQHQKYGFLSGVTRTVHSKAAGIVYTPFCKVLQNPIRRKDVLDQLVLDHMLSPVRAQAVAVGRKTMTAVAFNNICSASDRRKVRRLQGQWSPLHECTLDVKTLHKIVSSAFQLQPYGFTAGHLLQPFVEIGTEGSHCCGCS